MKRACFFLGHDFTESGICKRCLRDDGKRTDSERRAASAARQEWWDKNRARHLCGSCSHYKTIYGLDLDRDGRPGGEFGWMFCGHPVMGLRRAHQHLECVTRCDGHEVKPQSEGTEQGGRHGARDV